MTKYEEEVSYNPFTIQDEPAGCWKRLTVYLCNKAQRIGTNIIDDNMSWAQGLNDGNISMNHWGISQIPPTHTHKTMLCWNTITWHPKEMWKTDLL